jgi:antitoxin ParD1/3/4
LTVKISLTAENLSFLKELVGEGAHVSVQDAANALLAHVRHVESLTPQDIEELRAEVAIGLAEADRGEFVEFTAEDIKAEGRALLAKRQRKGA